MGLNTNKHNRRDTVKRVWALLRFELLCKAAFLMVLYPVCRLSFRFVLKVTGYSYLTLENIHGFLTHPATILAVVFVVLLCTLLWLTETVSLIVYYQEYVKNKEIRIAHILYPGLRETMELLRRKGKGAVFGFSFLSGLFNLFPMLLVLAIRFRVPAFIANTIMQVKIGLGIVVVFIVFCVLLNVFGAFSLYYCVLYETPFHKSFHQSIRFVRSHLFRYLLRLISLYVLQAAAYVLLYAGVMIFCCYIIYRTKSSKMVMAAILTAYDEVMLYMGILFTMLGQLVNYAFFSFFFTRYHTTAEVLNQIEKWREQISYGDAVRQMEYQEKAGGFRHACSRSTRIITLVSVFIVLLDAIYMYDWFRNGALVESETLFTIRITAHRGASADAPENTLPALLLAVEQMADYAEIDVRETRDGVLILMHDSTLRRTAGKNNMVEDLTYEQLGELEVGSWYSEEFAGEKIPTLREVMELCKGRINLNIELKKYRTPEQNRAFVEKVVELIQEYDMENQCIISSMESTILKEVRDLEPDLKTGYILSFAYGSFYDIDYVDFYSVKSSFLNEEMVKNIHSAGKEVHAWTVDTRSELERMKQLGVDNIITNQAVLAREVIYEEEGKLDFFKLLGLIRQ